MLRNMFLLISNKFFYGKKITCPTVTEITIAGKANKSIAGVHVPPNQCCSPRLVFLNIKVAYPQIKIWLKLYPLDKKNFYYFNDMKGQNALFVFDF